MPPFSCFHGRLGEATFDKWRWSSVIIKLVAVKQDTAKPAGKEERGVVSSKNLSEHFRSPLLFPHVEDKLRERIRTFKALSNKMPASQISSSTRSSSMASQSACFDRPWFANYD